MSGRHGTGSRTHPALTWGAIVVVAVVVVVGGYFGVQAVRAGSAGCDGTRQVSLAVDPTIAPVITDVLAQSDEVSRGCTDFEVRAEAPSDTAAELAGENANRPDLWIPDSTLWLLKTLRSTGALPELAKSSVANTLPVVVSQDDSLPPAVTWLQVLQKQGQRIGDPLTSSASLASILGALAESEVAITDANAVSAALVPMAQDFGRIADTPHEVADLVKQVATDGGTSVSTEQSLVAYNDANPGAPLTASVPPTGSYFLNFPLAVTAAAGPDYDRAKDAGASLSSVLSTKSATDALTAAGFRQSNGTALPDGKGVGSAASLELKNPLAIETTLRDWAVLALPLRTLVVEDVSGSMAAKSGDSTRIALTVDASLGANSLFSDQTEMGLWAFSIGLGGGNQDFRELVPLGPVSNMVDGVPQREAILSAIRTLPSLVGGGTGLYDTTLAAFRRVKEGYDPNYVNSVIILTDGANEDAGSPSLDELLATLQREQDPVRPIVIVTVGITTDADPVALQKISAATGGTSYIAEDPRDIPEVFVKALNSRTERVGGQ
ncbi:substrate-binding domain-containing protein [Rhodococcus sp. BP-252]|uniref:VWFA domain-containing protein n=1 Tax=Rhodococcoides kyotonense TaxID=398843 RepID=A0A177YH39_9NOCA|nr:MULTISPECIES: VWA domain-containing protein [Rhodococcus]MBY6413113.1 substrate-binding domain-containing protein [Rhodococcus sp. BP-320]MBY6417724.1 substrate-binding domain-containing protein [Rhodococcus sp. BP-321]MBY6423252.1 substrate-binding domain-containing protein [Rhodococcus sp. BP-324]MBY6427855.1 substrate-binding domain-containing protein [Rhodococcus sp. BP-323]MBY6431854.1 substrate-binding domain-containing protein [Rhodococcus sp. BP-322]